MTVEFIALALTMVVHLLGAAVLIWALMDGERFDWGVLRPRDDDGGGGGRGPEDPGGPPGSPGPGGAALGTEPSRVRLREPGRISDGRPRPPRRPGHAPEPSRVPQRG